MQSAVGRFSKYYESFESRPVFETVTEMLNWSGLYNLTTRTLFEELIDARLSRLLIQELVTVRTFDLAFLFARISINYCQLHVLITLFHSFAHCSQWFITIGDWGGFSVLLM